MRLPRGILGEVCYEMRWRKLTTRLRRGACQVLDDSLLTIEFHPFYGQSSSCLSLSDVCILAIINMGPRLIFQFTCSLLHYKNAYSMNRILPK